MLALIINCSPVRTGATAAIVSHIADCLASRYGVRTACIADWDFAYCRGCRACHATGACVMDDGAQQLIAAMDAADVIVCVSPSYWADVPGQFKAFIDRCTPWCNTHEPHASLRPGKRGYAVALRTGTGTAECERIAATIEHFYGHMEIARCGRLCLTGVENRTDALLRLDEITAWCADI